MPVVCLTNNKGGVGKTTTVINLGTALVEKGLRVLAVDADAQACLTNGLGVDATDGTPTLYDVLSDDAIAPADAVRETDIEGLHVLPGTIDLAALDTELARAGDIGALRDRLSPIFDAYDFVLIDTPPGLTFLTLNALVASTGAIIPLDVGSFAILGIDNLLRAIDQVRKHNPDLQVLGFLVAMYDGRTPLSDEVLDHLRGHFGDRVFNTYIRRTIRLVRSSIDQEPILTWEPGGDISQAYRALADEVIARAETT